MPGGVGGKARKGLPIPRRAGHVCLVKRCKSAANLIEVKASETQGHYREVLSEGSV